MSEAAAPADGAQTPADAPAADTAPEAPAAPDTAAQDAPDGGEVVEDQDQDQDHDHDGDGREAAKYRKKLRDAATQRDQAVEQITTMQKSEAERIAANRLADGADLWRDGLTVGELLDDAGNLDPAKVSAAAKAVTQQHPHWRRPAQPRALGGRTGVLASGASSPNDHRAPSWSQVLREAVHGPQ